MITTILMTLALSLVAYAQTNEWELQGDSLLKARPDLAVKLYAKSLLTDGTTAMSLQTPAEQEPYIIAMERVLDKLPWASADPQEFKSLMGQLKPILRREFTGPKRRERVKQLVSRYKMLRSDGEPDEFPNDAHYAVDVAVVEKMSIEKVLVERVSIEKVLVERVPIETVPVVLSVIPEFDIASVDIVYITTDMTEVDWDKVPRTSIFIVSPDTTDIPVDIIAVTLVSVADTDEWVAVHAMAFSIMGADGLYVPSHNSYLGHRHRVLKSKLAASDGWKDDPVLVAEWEAYWHVVKRALSRRVKAQTRRENARNR